MNSMKIKKKNIRKSNMKIGTLSFELEGEKMALRSGSDRVEIIVAVAGKYKPEFILCSGYSLENNENLIELESKLQEQDNKTTILVEVKNDIDIENNGHPVNDVLPEYETSTHKMFIIDPESGIKELGPQFFATSGELDKKPNNKTLLDEFEKHFDSRIFSIGKHKAVALCCGELNILKGRDDVICRSSKVEKAIHSVDIVVNPTHDRMSIGWILKPKREYLSRKISDRSRCYVSSSNWNTEKRNSQGKIIRQKPTPTIHTLYLNGTKQEMEQYHTGEYEFRLLDIEEL